jgi:hypothetical protein
MIPTSHLLVSRLQGDDSIIPAFATINHAGPGRLTIDVEEEVVTDKLHLIKSLL